MNSLLFFASLASGFILGYMASALIRRIHKDGEIEWLIWVTRQEIEDLRNDVDYWRRKYLVAKYPHLKRYWEEENANQ